MPDTTPTTAESVLGPITPICCTEPGCHWSVHGVPDKYTESRARILADHKADEHAPKPEPVPAAVWIEGDPLMEAIAVAVYEQAETTEGGLVVEDPRNIAAAAATTARQVLGTTDQQHRPPCTDGDHCGEAAHCPPEDLAERPLSPFYEHPACGFHWHGRDGMDIPMRGGQPLCPRCELAALRAELAAAAVATDQQPTHATTADKAAAFGKTPTAYRQYCHDAAVEQIREAALLLLAETGQRVMDALDGRTDQQPATAPTDRAAADQPADRRARWEHAAWAAGRTVDRNALAAYMAVADTEQAALRAEVEGLDEALRGAIAVSEKDGARLRAEVERLRIDREWWKRQAHTALSHPADAHRAVGLRRMADEAQQPECTASTSGTCLAERQSDGACDTEASECVHGERPADEAQQPTCTCGEPDVSGTVHRTDGPCYIDEAQQPETEAGRLPCSLAVLKRPHTPHTWEPQPGMTPLVCPGTEPVTEVVEDESCGRFVPDTPRAPGLCASCGDARGWHSLEAVGEQQPDTELTATLIIGRSTSRCGGCGEDVLPQDTHHIDVAGWTPGPGEGCGARFVAMRSDYAGTTADALKSVRPDLPVEADTAP